MVRSINSKEINIIIPRGHTYIYRNHCMQTHTSKDKYVWPKGQLFPYMLQENRVSIKKGEQIVKQRSQLLSHLLEVAEFKI